MAGYGAALRSGGYRPLRLRVAAVAFALPLFASACGSSGGGNTYPDNIRNNFLSSCVGGVVTEKMCTCMIDGLEDIYTLDQFRAMEQRLQRNQPDARFDKIIEDCVK